MNHSKGFLGWALALLLVFGWLGSVPALAADSPSPRGILGSMFGTDWLAADPGQKLAYCEKAFKAFRSSPSQSYIISSNVQAMNPEGFCQRLDQFYSYPINEETRLDQASALAPLLFSDTPLKG